MKVDTVLDEKGISLSELARRLGLSRQAVSKWDEIPEKWRLAVSEMKSEPEMGEVPEDIWEWDVARIKAEVCSRRAKEDDWEIAASLGLRGWEYRKLIDKVVKYGMDGLPRLPINRSE